MKIIITTTFTPYTNDVVISPKAPLWFLWNSGKKDVVINDVYTISYQRFFGINTQNLFRLQLSRFLKDAKSFRIEQEAQFKLHFTEDTFYQNSPFPDKQVMLVATNFKILR